MWISCVILAVAAGGYALWPLFAKTFNNTAIYAGGHTSSETENNADYLSERKKSLYRNIKELEFEYKMGRLTEADFQRLDAEYKYEAVEILKKLDVINASTIKQEPHRETGVCPACGAKSIPDKKFCADCGARLPV